MYKVLISFRAGRKDFLIQIMDKTEFVFHNFHQINHSEKYLNLKEVIFSLFSSEGSRVRRHLAAVSAKGIIQTYI